jgi:type I restriction enzyme S subunit
LLQEKRQAVISHAVTKGLNPAAPLRDSGVEWLGQVPAHWEVKKLGHLGELQNGLNIGGDAFGSGDPFVSYGDVYNNAIVPSLPTGLVQSTADDQIKYSLKSGDVLFTRTSETVDDIGVASTCLQEIPKVTFAGFLIRFRPLPGKLNPNYSSFLFRNRSIQDFFAGSMNLVTRASLSQNVLKTLPVCVPPIDEQVPIAIYLKKTASVFDQLEHNLVRQEEILQERRTALIAAAVTGKIDVRGWQPPVANAAAGFDEPHGAKAKAAVLASDAG